MSRGPSATWKLAGADAHCAVMREDQLTRFSLSRLHIADPVIVRAFQLRFYQVNKLPL